MKYKSIIYLLVLFIFTANANSQSKNGITFLTGTVINNQKHYIAEIDYTLENQSIIGLTSKIGFTYPVKQRINMVANIGYIRKGSKTDFISATVNHLQNNELTITNGDSKKSTFDYLSIDVGVQYIVLNQKPVVYLIEALRVDNLMKYKTESNYEVVIDNEILAGLNTGIGIIYSLEKYSVFLEIQKLFDFSQVMNSKGIELRNKAYSISAGLVYYLVPKN